MKLQTILLLSTATTILYGCSCPSKTSSTSLNPAPMSGAYASADVSDPEVQSCAAFAVDNLEPKGSVKLVTIRSVEKQVVAGMNYKLSLTVVKNGSEVDVTAVVWSKLDGTKELTTFRY